MEYASASRVTAGTAPLIPWVRVFMISWNGIPWSSMLMLMKMITNRNASIVFAEPRVI